MAEAFIQVLLENLGSLIQKEIGSIVGADKEMNKLSSTLTTIQAVVEDAEDRQFESQQIRNWLRKLNDLAFEIDDLLDECGIEVSKLEKKNNKFRSLKKILLQHKIGRRIKEMADKLDVVAAERKKFHFRETSYERQTDSNARRAIRETGSVLNEPVLGRDEEKEKIVDILVNQAKDCQHLSILPILGLGGLGKTSLAQLVYNDQRIKEHFELKMWVCVSDDFDSKVLIKAMIESATRSGIASDLMNLDALECRLSELVNNKRYLLVLDDVWNDDQEKWDKLKKVLACGSRGASIVVTTRLKKVADIMRTVPTHCLSELSDEHCWLLFKQRAFGEQVEPLPNFESIGREIVKKCSGVPLAAKALGGLLRFKNDEKEWLYVKESELWKLEQEETSILPSLRLSYRHLPLVLRRCFAYCALFPKDTKINKEGLIYLWMSHGCISSNGGKEVEDVGHGVWNELVLRSLLQLEGNATTCKMHDLVHDLALSIMENQVPGTHANNSPTQSDSKIRQVCVARRSITLPTSIQLRVSTFTSLVNFSHIRRLTVISSIKALPPSIGKLKQLRSLNLFNTSIQTLPNRICGLQKLQILNLTECAQLVRLPKNMRYMDSLRHLFLEGCDSLIEMPSRIGDLTFLKTLSQFIVGDKIGHQLGELEHLNLGGRLVIKHLERVKDQMDAKKANLSAKPNLRDLVLNWEGDDTAESRGLMDEMVLEALEPHPNIKTLKISGYGGRSFPFWRRNSTVINIVEIVIGDCRNCLHLTPLGDLPQLERLTLSKLNMIEFITEDDVEGRKPFPSLEELYLSSLPNLKGLSKKGMRKSIMNNVVEISIYDCPNCLHLSPLGDMPRLERLRLSRLNMIEFIIEDEVEGGNSVPSLEVLDLRSLPNLKGFSKKEMREMSPNLQSNMLLPSLKELTVRNCNNSTLPSFPKLDNLTSLKVAFDENMTCIPKEALENLSNLKELRIENSDEHSLPAEVLQGLKSLTHMTIHGMRKGLTCLPEEWFQHLTTLKKLTIVGCEDLIEVPDGIKYLHSLKILRLPKLGCLPEGLQHLHSLERLYLFDLDQLTSLPGWLDKLTSLEYLSIQSCPRIASLPSNIQRMANLQTLFIDNCSAELKRRCEEGRGEDWHYIAHIPKRQIYSLE